MCPKCGSIERPKVYYRVRFFAPWTPTSVYQGPGQYWPIACRTGECPGDEHLHKVCACGAGWIDACHGQQLSAPYEPSVVIVEPPQKKPSRWMRWLRHSWAD